MRKPRIKIYAVNQKVDGKKAALFEEYFNTQWKKYRPIIEAILQVKKNIEVVYGIETDWRMWNKILEEVIQLDIQNMTKENNGDD